MLSEIFYYGLAFIFGLIIWLPIYKYTISTWVGDSVVARCESGEIDLNYLLDEGGVFDELASRVVLLFKQNMLAEMGQLSRQSAVNGGVNEDTGEVDPISAGLQVSNELLKAVGMKKPPAILQYKLAQALGKMVEGATPKEEGATVSVDLQYDDQMF